MSSENDPAAFHLIIALLLSLCALGLELTPIYPLKHEVFKTAYVVRNHIEHFLALRNIHRGLGNHFLNYSPLFVLVWIRTLFDLRINDLLFAGRYIYT